MNASALLAAVGQGRQFKKARDLAAWLGLVPREHSTGGKTTLLAISKRGNEYVRRLLITGLDRALLHLDRAGIASAYGSSPTKEHARQQSHRGSGRQNRPDRRVIITRPGALYERVDPVFG